MNPRRRRGLLAAATLAITPALPHVRLAPTADALDSLLRTAHAATALHERNRRSFLNSHLRQFGLELPTTDFPLSSGAPENPLYLLDVPLKTVLSQFIRAKRPTLPEFVELWRHQTSEDYRPNKAIDPVALQSWCAGYENLDHLLDIATRGITVYTTSIPKQSKSPLRNHPSADERHNVLIKTVRVEQDAGRCLVLDLDILELWPQIQLSPYGVVNKSNSDPRTTGRLIHDLSSPAGTSVNDITDSTRFPRPQYQLPSRIALEIERLRRQDDHATPELLCGDVASAFRHCSIHSSCVHHFGGRIPAANALVIDLSAPFGWTLSPAAYEIVGGAVSFIHGSTRPVASAAPCFSYHWVDDHVCVTSSYHAEVERSLRAAMISVLGASAINETKFTGWHTRLKILGLQFDAASRKVSMPPDKIAKAQQLVLAAHQATSLTVSEYRSLLGSLRHVATCIRPARVFLQRLRRSEKHLHRQRRVLVTTTMDADLRWWWAILHDPVLNGVPLTYFGALPPPDIMIVMDASDYGLCALDPAGRTSLVHVFAGDDAAALSDFKSGGKNQFDINFRELLSCVHAVYHWGDRWAHPRQARPRHVQFHIDNTSAVSWQSKLHSGNERAQTLIRLLSIWEHQLHLRFSAVHVPGAANVVADLGSRVAQAPRKLTVFNNALCDWQQVQSTLTTADFESIWHGICENTPWPSQHWPSTDDTSIGGSYSAGKLT